MRWLLLLIACIAFQGCTSPKIIAGGPTANQTTFIFMREDRLITYFSVSCRVSEDWETRWTISGETTDGTIDYGHLPEGMKTVFPVVPFEDGSDLCKAEAHSRKPGGRTRVDKAVFIVDPYVQTCDSERICIQLMIDSITDATPRASDTYAAAFGPVASR